MIYKTFQEWESISYHIIKGERSIKRDKNGICLFSNKQVEKNRTIPLDIQVELLCINEADLY